MIPRGVATPKQWLQMDGVAIELGSQTIKFTTRQTVQFHSVIKSKLIPAIQSINRALMRTIAACSDLNRNGYYTRRQAVVGTVTDLSGDANLETSYFSKA